ncbi:MAG: hypothetical protein HWD92_04055 [Flavobacteriia bacterium]|nr:hypothetical protein [Flavobacteriia bacterium]
MATVRFFIFINLLPLLAFGQVVQRIELPDEVEEASGVVFSSEGFVYIINDSGNAPRLFEFSYPQMELMGSYFIDGMNRDWEAIAMDRVGYFYICDVGDNQNQYYRKTYYRFHRRDLNHQFDTIVPEVYHLNLPEENRTDQHQDYDWESAVIYRGQIHHFSKNRRDHYDGTVLSFSFDLFQDSIERIDSTRIDGRTRELNWITDATISPDGRHLFLLSSTRIFAYLDFPQDDFFKGYPMEIHLPDLQQREGLCFTSAEEIAIVSEDHRILGDGVLERVDLSPLLREYALMRKGEVKLDTNVFDTVIQFQVESITDSEVYYELYSDEGRVVKRGALGSVYAEMPVNLEIDTQDFPAGYYMLNVLTGKNAHGFFLTKYGTFNPSPDATGPQDPTQPEER